MRDQIELSVQGNMTMLRERAWWAPMLLAFLLGLPGVAVAIYFWPGWIAFAGLVWAALNWGPIVQAVLGL